MNESQSGVEREEGVWLYEEAVEAVGGLTRAGPVNY